MKKVFIPDNQGGGTWETWKDDRLSVSIEDARRAVAYKAHADKLAEALRDIRDACFDTSIGIETSRIGRIYSVAKAACDIYDAAQ